MINIGKSFQAMEKINLEMKTIIGFKGVNIPDNSTSELTFATFPDTIIQVICSSNVHKNIELFLNSGGTTTSHDSTHASAHLKTIT